MEKTKINTRDIVFIAIYVAIFYIVELVVGNLGVLHMAEGGKLGLSTIVLLIASYHLGAVKGVIIALAGVLLRFVSGHIHMTTGLVGFMLDYVLAYALYGLVVLIPNYKYFYPGIIVANILRLLLSGYSGVLFYKLSWAASLAYNAAYIIPTMVVAFIAVPIIFERMKKTKLID